MKVLVVMYWTWFAISVFVLGRRAVRRMFGRTPARPAVESGNVGAGPALIESLAQRVHERAAAAAEAARTAEGAPAVATEPAAEIEGSNEVEAPGDVATRPLPRPARSPIGGARPTLAEALAGISMPSDLAPLMQVSGADMVRRAVFATTTATLERVDAELLAELERLGYDLDRVGPHAALARRGDDSLALRLHVIGPQPKKGPADENYPTAPAGSVVLDLELT